jgi:3-hydroxyisobutyrate dehydrogenase
MQLTTVLHNAGLNVVGYDVWEGAREAYKQAQGKVADDVLDCAKGCDVFLLIVVNAAQVEDILFAQGALTGECCQPLISRLHAIPAQP